jgi:hypothetical protein
MKKKLALFGATLAIALAATFTFAARAGQSSCSAHCKNSYRSCVNAAKNPGGLNQCRKAYEACLAGCR